MAPPWVAPPTDRGDKSDESKNPPTGAKSNIRDNRPLSFRGILYNLRDLEKIYVTRHFWTSLSMGAQMGMTSLDGQNPNAHAFMQSKGTLSIILHDA